MSDALEMLTIVTTAGLSDRARTVAVDSVVVMTMFMTMILMVMSRLAVVVVVVVVVVAMSDSSETDSGALPARTL